MQMSTPVQPRLLAPLRVRPDAEASERVLPALEAALTGGPALLPLPEHPQVRKDLLRALRPDLPLEDEPEPLAMVVPTSGATGEPKGVLIGAGAVRASAEGTHLRLGGAGTWLLALPPTHIAGLMVLARSVVAGTTPVALDLTEGFDPESFAAATVRLLGGSRGRRYTALVPRQVSALLDAGSIGREALAAYDAVLVGGSAVPEELVGRAREAGARIVLTYGMTETSGGCVYDGMPLDDVKAEIGEDGRIRLAGPVLARGYRLRPDLTREALNGGWLTTSDTGHLDTEGRLHVYGRIDDVAVTGGVNVPLLAVDAAVTSHPDVAEAAAVALPDPDWGHRIVAAVVAPAGTPSLDSVRDHVTRRLPSPYAPKALVPVPELPMLATGKVDRRTLAARLAGDATT